MKRARATEFSFFRVRRCHVDPRYLTREISLVSGAVPRNVSFPAVGCEINFALNSRVSRRRTSAGAENPTIATRRSTRAGRLTCPSKAR